MENFCLVNNFGDILIIGKSFADFIEKSESELVGKNFFDLIDSKDLPFSKENFLDFMQNNTNPFFVKFHSSSILLPCQVYNKVFNFHEETLTFLSCIPNQESLQRIPNPEMFKLLLDTMPDIVAFKDGKGRWLYANKVDIELFELENVDYYLKKDSDLAPFSPFYKEAFLACEDTDEKAWNKKIVSRGIEIIPRQNKSSKVYDIYKIPLFNSDGSRKGLVVLGRDITEMKIQEQEIRDEKNRLFTTLQSIGDGVIITDKTGIVNFVNPPALKLLDLTLEETVAKPIEDIFILENEQTGEKIPPPIFEVLKTKSLIRLSNHTLLISHNGTKHIIADSASPILNEDNELIGVILVFHSEEEQRRLKEEENKIQKLESVGILAGGIAHDFNNYLAIFSMNLDIINEMLKEPSLNFSQIKESINTMSSTVRQAELLTNQLLTFAKGGTPIPHTIDINTFLKQIVKFSTSGMSLNSIFDFDSHLPKVNVDEGQIAEVFTNLIVNAKEANSTQIIVSTSRITLQDNEIGDLPSDDYVQIIVQDNGKGLPFEISKKIFDPFFSTKDTGSGLGLSVVYSIIRKHNGAIKVYSNSKEGTAFFIYLPVSKETTNSVSESETTNFSSSQKKLNILVVDDNIVLGNILEKFLEKFSRDFLFFPSGEMAFSAIKDVNLDLDCALIDATIPGGMQGIEIIEQLKKSYPNIKTILMSGYSQDKVANLIEQKKINAFLKKPFTFKQIKAILESCLK